MIPIVAICGRPNVGKSTLYNRLLGEQKAVTSYLPGTTRDRLYGKATWRGREFILVDTGGISFQKRDKIISSVENQARLALLESDLVLFIIDIQQELNKEDLKAAEIIRQSKKKVILVANKVDNERLRKQTLELYKLGLGQPIAVSALHGTGTGDLLDSIINQLPAPPKTIPKSDRGIPVAICGRPNVGKSSILNQLLGEERMIISETAGTTRDAVDILYKYKDHQILFVDTPGIRRRGKVKKGIEKYSALRAIKAIERADIVLLVTDASEGIVKQDLHIAQYALEFYKGIILVVNKWDLVEQSQGLNSKLDSYLQYLRSQIAFLPWLPVIFTSALTGKNVKKIFDLILDVKSQRDKKVSIKKLNQIISEAILKRALKIPLSRKKVPKIYYSTQIKTNPPTFVFMVNNPSLFHFSYLRYLENTIRQNFGFWGTPIKIILKSKRN